MGNVVASEAELLLASMANAMPFDDFPEKVRLSVNSVAWYESDINRWVADPSGWKAVA